MPAPKRLLLLLGLVALIAVTVAALPAAHAGESCATCGDDPRFPEEAAFLASHGFPPSQYTVLISWSERARDGSSKYVTGYRIQKNGATPFDIYSDGATRLLEDSELDALGIVQKNWDLPPVDQSASLPSHVKKALPLQPEVETRKRGLQESGGVVLPSVDVAEALREDADRAAANGKGPTRIGVFVDLQEPVRLTNGAASQGFWQTLPDGARLWSLVFVSPDAYGMRLRFTGLSLPEGARLVVYNYDNPSESYGPYTEIPQGRSELWSATCFSENVAVECFVPSGARHTQAELTIDRVVHNYVPFGELSWAKAAGSCNLDVTCYNEWLATSKAVGGVGSIGATGSLFCTGALLSDNIPSSDIPYFLTANHCVSTSGQAATVEVYWLYQTPSCNAAPPAPASVPRTTGGAALLAATGSDSGTDFCLLRLNNPASSGTTFAGWSSNATPLGANTVAIHHPSGDYKRITFGVVTDVAESSRTIRPAARYYQSSWTNGVTEPGSSGSPLFNSSAQIIGQLWGGPSSCSPSSTKLDYYGRFDVSFPIVSSYLNAGQPAVSFASISTSVDEGQGAAVVTVQLSEVPGEWGSSSVSYATQDVTAKAGLHYVATSGVLTFGPAESSKTISVPLLDDTRTETVRSFSIALTNPVSCQLALNYLPAIVSIADDDPDSDNDGLSDYDETNAVFGYATNPNEPDSDHDGVPDGIEISLGTDPTDDSDTPAVRSVSVPAFSE